MLGVAGGAAPPCWVWRATALGGARPQRGAPGTAPAGRGGPGGCGRLALQRGDPAGLSRPGTAWPWRCGREGAGPRGEPPGEPQAALRWAPRALGLRLPHGARPNPAGGGRKRNRKRPRRVPTRCRHGASGPRNRGGETGHGAAHPIVYPPAAAGTRCLQPRSLSARPSSAAWQEGDGSDQIAPSCSRFHLQSAVPLRWPLCRAGPRAVPLGSPSTAVPAGAGPHLMSPAAAQGPGGPAAAPRRHPPSPSLASWWGRASPRLQPRATGPGLWGAGIQEAPKPPSVAAGSVCSPPPFPPCRGGAALPAGPKPVPPGLMCTAGRGRCRQRSPLFGRPQEPGSSSVGPASPKPEAGDTGPPWGQPPQAAPEVGCSLHHPQPRGDLRIAAHTRPTADCPQGRSRPGPHAWLPGGGEHARWADIPPPRAAQWGL